MGTRTAELHGRRLNFSSDDSFSISALKQILIKTTYIEVKISFLYLTASKAKKEFLGQEVCLIHTYSQASLPPLPK